MRRRRQPPSRPTAERQRSAGRSDRVLAGKADHQAVGIVGFPDAEALSAWFNSPEYQALVPLRDEAADITIITYSVPA